MKLLTSEPSNVDRHCSKVSRMLIQILDALALPAVVVLGGQGPTP